MNAVIAKSTATVAMAAALIGHSTLARADRLVDRNDGNGPSITINYSELDISKPQGLEVLYARIKHAAKAVCGFDGSPQELSRSRHLEACYRTSLDNAIRQINRPKLTALHRAKSRSALG